MPEPAVDSGRIQAVIESGETEQTTALLEGLEELAVDEQLATFEASYETLLECMRLEDGYSRQAVVRVVSELDVALGRLAIEMAPEEFETTPSGERFADAIDRSGTIFVAALADEDGRVRTAAVRGLEGLAVGCRLTGDEATLERILADIDSLSVPDACEAHVSEASETIRSQLR